MTLTAVLVDVGGTLWPDRSLPDESEIRRDRMRVACRDLSDARLEALIGSLQRHALEWDATSALVQDTDRVVREALAQFEITDLDPVRIRRAMRVPVTPGILFEGAAALLKSIKNLGLRCVILSNTAWRDAVDYLADFEALDLADCIDGVVTSLDTHYRKPSREIFKIAMHVAGAEAGAIVTIGDSEERDIIPAVALGMKALLVSIEEAAPRATRATASATSLTEAKELLEQMVRSQADSSGTDDR
ncbi:MAG: HAD family hydrolase [Actinomycetota bacterium]|nr:HAD family hydrolase [Actinomycetota bacterium]